MLVSEFLEAYPREMTTEQIHHGAEIPEVRAAQYYSYAYGLAAQAALRGEREYIPPLLPGLRSYEAEFNPNEFILNLKRYPGGWDYRNEVNFSVLNDTMTPLWEPLFQGRWPRRMDPETTLTTAMNGLALSSLADFVVREWFVKKFGTEALYTSDHTFLDRMTGAMQEVDATIVVLDAARRMLRKGKNVTVVPAPAQFERSNTGANADLLAIDLDEDRMTGIQVKTQVDKRTFARYDNERIVFVDGSIDLNNVRVVRTTKGRSTEAPKPWPGIVAMSRVHAIRLHGEQTKCLPPQFSGDIQAAKLMAREMVGKLRIDHRTLTGTIYDRIMHKL